MANHLLQVNLSNWKKNRHKYGNNILYYEGRGWGIKQTSEKKKTSVGLFSTFRHPLIGRWENCLNEDGTACWYTEALVNLGQARSISPWTKGIMCRNPEVACWLVLPWKLIYLSTGDGCLKISRPCYTLHACRNFWIWHMGEMTVTYIYFRQIFTIFLRFLKPFLQLIFMISAFGQNDRYNRYISAFLERLLCITAELIEMVQYKGFCRSTAHFVGGVAPPCPAHL